MKQTFFDPSVPFDVPPLPPSGGLETPAMLKANVSAHYQLGRLNQASALIPNPDVLINTLPLLEAKASSAIENIVTTNDALFAHAELGEESADPATKETFRYRTALKEGFESLKEKPISTSTAIRICSTIKNREMDIRRIPGTTLKNPQTNAVIYTPPVGEASIREKLANWESFIHDQLDVDVLIRMAAAHYQFEAIHPFTDGNGRTGRLLNQLMLVEAGLIDSPILYLSRYIIRNRADYYRLLLEVTANAAWEPWIVFMLEGVADTADWTVRKIGATRSLMEHTAEFVRRQLPKVYSRELVELIFVQPYSRIENLVDAKIAKRQTASAYLKKLAAIGVLQERKVGREKLFVHPKFLELLASEEHTFLPYTLPSVNAS